MLERIALHQTRLRTPGLGLDGKGVALGSRGLILLPSIDRLVAFLAVYTRERSLEDLLPSLRIELLRSKLGTRELSLSISAESSDRMDKLADTARLVGGFAFTGTSRHFVQYRDAGAPFGYDAPELVSAEADVLLYHDKFTQAYTLDKPVDLRALLLRLSPHVDPSTNQEPGAKIIVAEQGLGPALIHYFVRSQVEAEVAVAEWPPESAFDDAGVRRYLFRVPELPRRMRGLLFDTPGIGVFLPAGPGVAVQIGHRHPITLRACPVFAPQGLVLVRGGGQEPLEVASLPSFGDVRAFARVELLAEQRLPLTSSAAATVPGVQVALRVVPSQTPWKNVSAAWLASEDLALFRKLAYALPRSTLESTRVALTARGAFVYCASGIEAIPLGTFYTELRPGLFIPAGTETVPSVHPDVLYRALGSPSGKLVFIDRDGQALALEESALAPLDGMLVNAPAWTALEAAAVDDDALLAPIELRCEPLGLFPLRGLSDSEVTALLPEGG